MGGVCESEREGVRHDYEVFSEEYIFCIPCIGAECSWSNWLLLLLLLMLTDKETK